MATTYHADVALIPDITVSTPGAHFALGPDGLTGPTHIDSIATSDPQYTTKCVSIEKVGASFVVTLVFPPGSSALNVGAPPILNATISGLNCTLTVPSAPSEANHEVTYAYTPTDLSGDPNNVRVTVRVRTGTTSVV